MKLPSFPQRGQQKQLQVLELPDGAPHQLAQWLSRAKFTQQMIRWFSLIRPEFDAVYSEMNTGMGQLVGQARAEAESVLRTGQFIRRDEVDGMVMARMTMMLAAGDDRPTAMGIGPSGDDRPTAMGTRPWSEFQVIQGLRAGRTAAAQFYPAFFIETDSGSSLVYYTSAAGVWTYLTGEYRSTLANILTGLGTADAGLKQVVTDYSHTLRWTGSAWEWNDGDDGSDFYRLYESVPSGYGASAWALCDGSTVARLNSDGTTTNITLDDVTTARYLKGGLTSAGVAAAGGVTTSVSGGTPVGSVAAPVFTGDAVAAASTNATPDLVAPDVTGTGVSPVTTATGTNSAPTFTGSALAGHDHGPNTLELANLQKRLYYRR